MHEDEDDGDGDDKIAKTQDDPLSLLILDFGRIEVEKLDHETIGSDDKV